MAEEADGVIEGLNEHGRIAIMVATQFGQQIARLRAELARDDARSSSEEGRLIAARFEAERAGAIAQLAPTFEENWWAGAGSQDIANAWETAQAWKDFDPRAEAAAERIHDEVLERYDVDVNNPGGPQIVVSDAIMDREVREGLARTHAERDGLELSAAQLLIAAENERFAAENPIDFDQAVAEHYEEMYTHHPEIPAAALEAKRLADLDQGVHAREAVNVAMAAAPRAYVAPQQGRVNEISGR